MSEPEDVEFDDAQLSNDALWNFEPLPPGTNPNAATVSNPAPGHRLTPWKRSREPQDVAPESTQPPWKRSNGKRPVGVDISTRELRNKALRLNWRSDRPAPGKKYAIAVPLAGAMLCAVGFAGSKLGFGLTGLVSEELAPTTQALKSSPLSSASAAADAAVVGSGAPALANAHRPGPNLVGSTPHTTSQPK
jgi:hypothetical protein